MQLIPLGIGLFFLIAGIIFRGEAFGQDRKWKIVFHIFSMLYIGAGILLISLAILDFFNILNSNL